MARLPRYRWDLLPLLPVDPALLLAAQGLSLSARVTSLLAGRGIADAAALRAFFGTPESGLHDPALLPDAAIFVERIGQARAKGS